MRLSVIAYGALVGLAFFSALFSSPGVRSAERVVGLSASQVSPAPTLSPIAAPTLTPKPGSSHRPGSPLGAHIPATSPHNASVTSRHQGTSKPVAHFAPIAVRSASPKPNAALSTAKGAGYNVVQVHVTVPPTDAPPPVVSDQDAPQILSLSLSTTQIHSGDTVVGNVVTSPNVSQVVASLYGFSQALTKTSAGHFSMSYQVPALPTWIHGSYTIQVVATGLKGAVAQREVSVQVP